MTYEKELSRIRNRMEESEPVHRLGSMQRRSDRCAKALAWYREQENIQFQLVDIILVSIVWGFGFWIYEFIANLAWTGLWSEITTGTCSLFGMPLFSSEVFSEMFLYGGTIVFALIYGFYWWQRYCGIFAEDLEPVGVLIEDLDRRLSVWFHGAFRGGSKALRRYGDEL